MMLHSGGKKTLEPQKKQQTRGNAFTNRRWVLLSKILRFLLSASWTRHNFLSKRIGNSYFVWATFKLELRLIEVVCLWKGRTHGCKSIFSCCWTLKQMFDVLRAQFHSYRRVRGVLKISSPNMFPSDAKIIFTKDMNTISISV